MGEVQGYNFRNTWDWLPLGYLCNIWREISTKELNDQIIVSGGSFWGCREESVVETYICLHTFVFHTFGEPLANRCLISWLSLGGPVVKNLPADTGDAKFDLWVRKIPWRRKWQPTLASLRWKCPGQRSLVGYSPWGHKRVRHNSATKQTVHFQWLYVQIYRRATLTVIHLPDFSPSAWNYPSWVTEHTRTSWVKMILNREIGMCIKLPQSCLTLCNPMDDSPPGFSVHWILQARILEWFAMSSSRGSSRPRDHAHVSCIAGRFFSIWVTRSLGTHKILVKLIRQIRRQGKNRLKT